LQENDYFCTQNQKKLKINSIYIQLFALLLLCSCQQKKQEPVVTPWGEISDTIPADDDFDLSDIQRNGELIALTLTGPET
jgi:membrane-bound lytic murein transglycosylase F